MGNYQNEPGKSTFNAIDEVEQILQKLHEYNRELYICSSISEARLTR